ncbi:MAG TPA: FAD-dependent oxidoreductase, partial [Vicinamibacterales bacterium]
MRRDLRALTRTEFDVLIVGGGITGACLAHDAALRGLSVALVEKGDFGGATSSASSKLLHSGIRYLQTLQFHKVRESAVERIRFQRIAPHLVRWVPFLVPTYRDLRKGRLLLGAGMAVYDLICAGHDRELPDGRRPPRRRVLEPDAIARELPALAGAPGLTGGHLFHELHMNSSERMTLAFIRTAAREGAAVANYAAVEEFLVDGSRVRGAVVRDELTGERLHVRAHVTVNAAGPWIPALNARLPVGRLPRPITHYSKGAHIVTRQLTPGFAVALPSSRRGAAIVNRGGRHIFVIPWRGYSLIGTSDSPFDQDLDTVAPGEDDIEGLLRDVAAAMPGAGLEWRDVRHAFAGLYPLTGTVQP